MPFVIAEFGCATGAASVLPLKTIISAVRKFSPEMPIQVFLNDLPENHHSLAIAAVTEGLSHLFEEVYIMVAGKDSYPYLLRHELTIYSSWRHPRS
jgi:SAM dependent carboxyl methyltransferase